MANLEQGFDHWSRYWASGALTSMPEDFRANYDGELAAFWAERFSGLPESAALLDVCTGNGAIALLAARWAKEKGRDGLEISAIDAARIDPAVIAARWPEAADLVPGIRFLPQSPLETLDLPAASFDMVSSQYGLEYCDLRLAVPRLVEVLKPGGLLVMLAHDLSSAMVSTMESEARDYALLETIGFMRLLKRWQAGVLDAGAIQAGLSSAARALSSTSPIGGQILPQVFQSCQALLAMSPGQLLAQRATAGGYFEQLEAGRLRTADMLRVNQQIGQGDGWLAWFDEAGLELVETRPMMYRQLHNVGVARWWQKR